MKIISAICFLTISMLSESFGICGNHGIRNGQFSPLLWLFLILLIISAGIILYRFVSKISTNLNDDENTDAIGIVKVRFANGEINKNIYNDILHIIKQNSDIDYIEKLKIRLAKGEITISEFKEMRELLSR